MTLEKFFEQFRTEVDDLKTPYLWSTSDLESYFNWALEELAKKAMYFYDQSTWLGMTIDASDPKITATSANYLDRILYIRRAKLGSTGQKLKVKTMSQSDLVAHEDDYGEYLYDTSSAWETTTGTPQLVITDYYDDGSLRVGPIPTAADTLDIWAYRLPLWEVSYEVSKFITLKELLNIKEHSHELTLLQGMKAKAYLKEDPETRDDQLATQSITAFAIELSDIKQELRRRRHPPGTVRYGGI